MVVIKVSLGGHLVSGNGKLGKQVLWGLLRYNYSSVHFTPIACMVVCILLGK